MSTDAAIIVWPVLMILSALIPVLLGLRDYRRSR